eukprot:CAMPEP_0197029976 /NCGR_PEP_ID=MMETSP1384-20130603/9314_1 /TAXON_ID=29189 /ORGANISM="Ammonia sp." /LENGTH=419 /DNA_ID=CAMNT_0042459247 /DNA_START=47 /DNA_END=1306 /DNA_ORIENTATION=-
MAFVARLFVSVVLACIVIDEAAVPMIFDADFGGPIDDTFAMAYLLKKQECGDIDVRLISMVGRNTTLRATILAKFLQESGYSDQVDIGIGEPLPCGDFFSINCVGPAWPWMDQFGDWQLSDYHGTVYTNGVERMIEIIGEYDAENPIYVVTVGALTNLAEVILQRPDLKQNIKLFTMSGSLFNDTQPFGKFAEFNILDDIEAAQIVYNDRDVDPYFGGLICAVPWDTGYYLQIEGEEYQRLLASDDPLITTMMDMYTYWYPAGGYAFDSGRVFHPNNASASMYDLEAVWLAIYVAGLQKETELEKSCVASNVADSGYLTMLEFDVHVNATGTLYDIDDNNNAIPPVWFAASWQAPDGLAGIATEIVDVLLAECASQTTTEDAATTQDVATTDDESKATINAPFVCSILCSLCLLFHIYF